MTNAIALPRPEDRSDDGPAMSCLNDDQRKFVLAYVSTNLSIEQCTDRAGYTRENEGRRLMRNPRVLAALHEETVRYLGGSAAVGLRVLLEVAADKTHKDRLKAARELIAHAGLAPKIDQKITVEHIGQKPDELRAELRRLMNSLGNDAQRLLTAAEINITDADFEEVEVGIPTAEGPDAEGNW